MLKRDAFCFNDTPMR